MDQTNINMIITERKIDRTLQTDLSLVFQLRVSPKEFNAMNMCDRKVRYKYTLKRIVDTETIWLLSSAEDIILSLTHDEDTFIPIWSSKEYGHDFCKKIIREEYNCMPVSLYDFLDILTEYDHETDLKIGVFPTINDFMGSLVTIEVFVQSVDEEQEWYW